MKINQFAYYRWNYGLICFLLLFSHVEAFADSRFYRISAVVDAPYIYLSDDRTRGIASDVFDQITATLDLPRAQYRYDTWRNSVIATRSGVADLLFGAIKSEKRKRWGIYSTSALITKRYVLFKKTSKKVKLKPKFSGLKRMRIAIPLGFHLPASELKQALAQGRFRSQLKTISVQDSINALLDGRADLFIGDALSVTRLLEQQDLLDTIDIVKGKSGKSVVLTQPMYMLFSKKTVSKALVKKIDKVLEDMKADGRYQRIVERYSQLQY